MGLLTTARRDLRAALTRRLSLRDSSYGTTGRRSLRDEPPYGTFNCGAEGLTGRRDGGAYGTSLLTRRDGGAYGTSPSVMKESHEARRASVPYKKLVP